MVGRNTFPFRFNPRGVVDALDGGQIPPGGLLAASDLIFDPANPFTFQCRPAATETTDFEGFDTPGVVSVAHVVGDICYGMIASEENPGFDEPFAYNLVTDSFVTITGVTGSNVPATQLTTGPWVPPTMDLVGVKLYVTHPGFAGGMGAYFGYFNVTNPASPTWTATNTTGNALPAVPTNVKQFNNRAWFAVGEALWFTDALTTNITSASQVLVIGDSIDITALAQQPLVTSVQGIIQSLVVFKPSVIALVTGDAADGNLALNIISSSVGTYAPRTIAATPAGVKFMATDGIRTITQAGILEEPYPDLKLPFIHALNPSRASASYNNNVYRISVQNGNANGAPIQEYWFDMRQNGFTGPHSFIQSMSSPYLGTFIAFSNDNPAALYTSDVVQSGTSVFVENGEDLDFLMLTSPLADTGGLYENSAVLSVIDMQLPPTGDNYSFVASDVIHGVLAQATISGPTSAPIWGQFNWGDENWTAYQYGLERYNIPWNNTLVFSRMVWQITGKSAFGFKVGKLTVGYQPTRYVRII